MIQSLKGWRIVGKDVLMAAAAAIVVVVALVLGGEGRRSLWWWFFLLKDWKFVELKLGECADVADF